MKNLLYIFVTIAVIVLAFWAYQESFETKAALKKIKTVNTEINNAQEKLSVLRVEWAYLNRPDRLRALVDMNFKQLKLIELNTNHFDDLRSFELKDDLTEIGYGESNSIKFDSADINYEKLLISTNVFSWGRYSDKSDDR